MIWVYRILKSHLLNTRRIKLLLSVCSFQIVLTHLLVTQHSGAASISTIYHFFTSSNAIKPNLTLLWAGQSTVPYYVTQPLVKTSTDWEYIFALVKIYWKELYRFCLVFPEESSRNILNRYFTYNGSLALLDDWEELLVKAILLAICTLVSYFPWGETSASSYFRHAKDIIAVPTDCSFEYLLVTTLIVCFIMTFSKTVYWCARNTIVGLFICKVTISLDIESILI